MINDVILYGSRPPTVSCPLTNSMALVYDGVQLLAETYKHVNFRPVALSCGDDSAWDKGYTLVNYMKSVSRCIKRKYNNGQIYLTLENMNLFI